MSVLFGLLLVSATAFAMSPKPVEVENPKIAVSDSKCLLIAAALIEDYLSNEEAGFEVILDPSGYPKSIENLKTQERLDLSAIWQLADNKELIEFANHDLLIDSTMAYDATTKTCTSVSLEVTPNDQDRD